MQWGMAGGDVLILLGEIPLTYPPKRKGWYADWSGGHFLGLMPFRHNPLPVRTWQRFSRPYPEPSNLNVCAQESIPDQLIYGTATGRMLQGLPFQFWNRFLVTPSSYAVVRWKTALGPLLMQRRVRP